MNEYLKENADGDVVDTRYCPYCSKRKRGWRANEADVLCSACDADPALNGMDLCRK